MSNEAFETQLSALVDGELERDELACLLRRLSHDQKAVDQLASYFMISDALRRQLPEVMDTRLVERVREALEHEPPLQAEPALARRLLRPLAGLGVAASVAMVAITYWSGLERGDGGQSAAGFAATTLQQQTLQTGPVLPAAAPQKQQWERLDPAVQVRLQGYLVNHSEHAAGSQLGGMLNYVRMAGQQQARE